MTKSIKIPELLSPGGDSLSVKAAVLAGADSVYMGLGSFNARRKALNILEEELSNLCLLAESYNTKLYITANILLLEEEMKPYVEFLTRCINAGVSGFIVQDLGAMEIFRLLFPDADLHASTQTTTHNAGQIAYLKRFTVKRVNLARELPLERIKDLTKYAHSLGIETEVFVHGAYCLSYSGQCYMSSFMGGESGNRGICFQPCRRNYSFEGEEDSFLNLKDNNAINEIDLLLNTGLDALKIEGRMKNYQYVYTVVSTWRQALDHLERSVKNGSLPSGEGLGRVFNRGFSAGYLLDRVGREMFSESSFDQSLLYLGDVKGYKPEERILTLDRRVENLPEESLLYLVTKDNLLVCSLKMRKQISPVSMNVSLENQLKGRILPGLHLFSGHLRENTPGLVQRLDKLEIKKIPLKAVLSGGEGELLRLVFEIRRNGRNSAGIPLLNAGACEVFSTLELSAAAKAPLERETLQNQLGRLGNTPFVLEELDLEELSPGLFLPLKELNDLRRRGLAALGWSREQISVPDLPGFREQWGACQEGKKAAERTTRLAILVSEEKTAQRFSGHTLLWAVEDPERYPKNSEMIPWLPAITRDEDRNLILKALENSKAPLWIVNNTAFAEEANLLGKPWLGGPFLNCANSWAFSALSRTGAVGGFYSQELSLKQMLAIKTPEFFALGAIAFGPLLLMTTRQCLYSRVAGCPKARVDEECYHSCSRSLILKGKKGLAYHLVKTPWNDTRIFNDAFLWIPEMAKDLAGRIDYLLLDLRNLPGRSVSLEIQEEIVAYCSSLFGGKRTTQERGGGFSDGLPSLPFPCTRGNYRRGLS